MFEELVRISSRGWVPYDRGPHPEPLGVRCSQEEFAI